MSIEFSELGSPWAAMPLWASYCVELGRTWPLGPGKHRLGFVSTPCDSAAAGLITLGAMLQRLEDPAGDDLGAHRKRMQALAYEDDDVILRNVNNKKKFKFARADADGIWVAEQAQNPSTWLLHDANMADWYFDGEPPVVSQRGEILPFANLYRALSRSVAAIHEANLSTTDSGIVFAGRAAGLPATQTAVNSVRLRCGQVEAGLGNLLPIHGWSDASISRVRYLNPRAQNDLFDRGGGAALLVIADGPGAWHCVHSLKECRNSSTVAVVPRTADGDRLVELGNAIADLSNWYQRDAEVEELLPKPPRGIDTAILIQR